MGSPTARVARDCVLGRSAGGDALSGARPIRARRNTLHARPRDRHHHRSEPVPHRRIQRALECGHSFRRSQIYRLDLASGESTRLTRGSDYNEHPTVIDTPDGDWIVYMTTRDVDRHPGQLFLGTDWYAPAGDFTLGDVRDSLVRQTGPGEMTDAAVQPGVQRVRTGPAPVVF